MKLDEFIFLIYLNTVRDPCITCKKVKSPFYDRVYFTPVSSALLDIGYLFFVLMSIN